MGLSPRLDLRQSQQLVMTPQLQQAIRLLALSNLEIESFIAEELEKNPLLESTGSEDAGAGGEEALPEPSDDAALEEAPLDMEPDVEWGEDGVSDRIGMADAPLSGSGEGFDFDSAEDDGPALLDHLMAQAGEALSGTDLLIASIIIAELDETGYLRLATAEIARRLNVSPADVERVLGVVQGFDPPGIAARDLAECLALQAQDADRYDPAMKRLIQNLDYLAKGNLAALKRICGVDDEDLADMIAELRGYDPKPGCRFASGGSRIDAVVPDLLVAQRGKAWQIELNAATLPRLIVDRAYHARLAADAADKKAKLWLADCLANANWLVKALDQRARTILSVATEIVKRQEGFFRDGAAAMKPLTLKAVADAVGLHESTVSRVTSNKYLMCERGLFELKYFFTSSVGGGDGEEGASAEAVKTHIRALIAAEAPDEILSDDTLVDLLKEKGFAVARRTVAKYREACGLGSSVQRRRQKALAG